MLLPFGTKFQLPADGWLIINELIMLSSVDDSNVSGVMQLYVLMTMPCPKLFELDMMFSVAMDEAHTSDVNLLFVTVVSFFIMN